MPIEELETIRNYVERYDPDDTQWYIARDLLMEVDRLKAELVTARLDAEQAWDACDDLTEQYERKAA